jgi:AcrR family transcriptional regulator
VPDPLPLLPAVEAVVDDDLDPRVARSRRRVLDAAQALLCEQGFKGATIEGIASRCGVAKTTIYRHWASREHLLAEAIDDVAQCLPKPPATGQLRVDLVTALSHLAGVLDGAFGHLLAALVDAGERDDALADMQHSFAAERRGRTVGMLQDAIDIGELAPDVDVELLTDQLVGPVMYRRFMCRAPVDRPWIEQHVDALLAPHLVHSA